MPGPDTAVRLLRFFTGGFLTGGVLTNAFLPGSFRARFVAGRFLADFVERRTRGFAAMVLWSRKDSMPCQRGASHGRVCDCHSR
jgi:hypothetical protein